jgi:hypothetical protein
MVVAVTPAVRRAAKSLGLPAVLCGAAMLLSADPATAQNLVLNPGFENSTGTGTSLDWTVVAGNGTSFLDDRANAHAGIWSADFQAVSASQASSGTLSQTIATTPMTTYIVSFFLLNQGGPHDTFLATFGGQTVLSLTDAAAFGYTKYSATITTTARKSDSSVLAFTGEQDASNFDLDDVSVVAEGAPAPAVGAGLMSFAVVMICVAIRRTRTHILRRTLAGS